MPECLPKYWKTPSRHWISARAWKFLASFAAESPPPKWMCTRPEKKIRRVKWNHARTITLIPTASTIICMIIPTITRTPTTILMLTKANRIPTAVA